LKMEERPTRLRFCNNECQILRCSETIEFNTTIKDSPKLFFFCLFDSNITT